MKYLFVLFCLDLFLTCYIFVFYYSFDTAVIEKLHSLDDGILNPTISKIVSTVISAKDSTYSFVAPIVVKVLSPFGLLKDKPEEESTLKPDGTTTTVTSK
jgi:hypothetical protein